MNKQDICMGDIIEHQALGIGKICQLPVDQHRGTVFGAIFRYGVGRMVDRKYFTLTEAVIDPDELKPEVSGGR